MQEPFDIELEDVTYSVVPEIFKDAKEYMKIQKDEESQRLKLDDETELPLFREDAEVNFIGQQIAKHL